ncbi:MAG: DUF1189 family protein [Candidatus Aureabacteria bacterium]|nr:DUF1189 family protein [Candidatus Auribacterota bacterium]
MNFHRFFTMGWLGKSFLYFTLVLLPTVAFYFSTGSTFDLILTKILEVYREMDIPPITVKNGEVRTPGDQTFGKIINESNPNDSFAFYIDTRSNPDPSLDQKIRKGGGGMILYRDRLFVYNGKTSEERTISFKQLQGVNWTLDRQWIERMYQRFGKFLFLFLAVFMAVYRAMGKLIQWLLIAWYFSSKKKSGKEMFYSLALWSLVPATLFQTVIMGRFADPCCCGCGFYFIVLILTVLGIEKYLLDVPKEKPD